MPKLAAFEEDRRFSQTRLFIDWRRQPAKRRPPRGVVDAGNSILWQVAQSLRPAGQIRKIPVAKAAVPEWRSSSSAPRRSTGPMKHQHCALICKIASRGACRPLGVYLREDQQRSLYDNINPTRSVPIGPALDLTRPHGRGQM
jgi:hypothetical protein